MDRRPLGPPVPPHRLRHRLARAQAIVTRPGIPRRRLKILGVVIAVGFIAIGVWKVTHASHPALPLIVGVDDDTLKWTPFPLTVVRREQSVGAGAVRVWVPWNGEIRPTAVRRVELSRAETAARRTTVVLAVFGFGAQTPTAPWAQRRFCTYAKSALALVPDARAVVVWNEANSPTYWRGTAAQYESLLARCYDALHSQHVQVLDSTASAHAPVRFLDALAAAYRDSGRTRPLVDAFGHNPYPLTPTELPTVVHRGDFLGEADYTRLVSALEAFGRTPSIWYLEDGFQTTKISPAQQARDVTTAVDMAACQPLVHAFFNFELVDETRIAGWHSGLIWRGGRVKPAAAAFAQAPRRCHT